MGNLSKSLLEAKCYMTEEDSQSELKKIYDELNSATNDYIYIIPRTYSESLKQEIAYGFHHLIENGFLEYDTDVSHDDNGRPTGSENYYWFTPKGLELSFEDFLHHFERPSTPKPEYSTDTLDEAKEDRRGQVVAYLVQNPGATVAEIGRAIWGRDINTLGRDSTQVVTIVRTISSALKSGAIGRDDRRKPHKYYARSAAGTLIGAPEDIGGSPVKRTTPTTQTTTKTTTPAKSKTNSPEQVLEIIKTDLNYFNPGRAWMDEKAEIDGNRVSRQFRGLGNWIDDEEDGQEDYEDNDQRIWAPGEYRKYMKIFQDWASNKSWYNQVKLDLQTSEKDWCEFIITLK